MPDVAELVVRIAGLSEAEREVAAVLFGDGAPLD